VDVNEAYLAMSGYSYEELLELSVRELDAVEQTADTRDHLKKIMDNKIDRFSTVHRRKDGSTFEVDVTVTVLEEENLMVSFVRDVSDIRKMETQYANLFSKMLDGFAVHEIICDDAGEPIDYRFIEVNPAFERLTGIIAEEVIGHTVLEVFPNTESYWIKTYGQVALTGAPITFRNYSADLDKHFEVTAYQPLHGYFACIFVDISQEIKDAKEKSQLQKRVQQAQKMEAIGTLSGGIAHDFNNILAAILGFTELARDELPSWSPAVHQLDEVIKAASRAKELVRQILTFSRQDDQKRMPINVFRVIKEASNFLRATIPTSVQINQNLQRDCGFIFGDATQIHQVLMNLCLNSAHAIGEGPGSIQIDLESVQINESVGSIPPGSYVRLSVRDTGKGIDPSIIERIFDPYFTTKELGRGTGMGLAVVHGIVKEHEGFLEVESEVGQGTVFRILLPIAQELSLIQDEEPEAMPRGQEHILLVDDEEALVRLAEKRLQTLGYQVTAARSSVDALEMVQKDPDRFDLILTDHTMPGLTGTQLAHCVEEINPDLPIILCTGFSGKLTEEDLKEAPIKSVLDKPYTRERLAEVIRTALDEGIQNSDNRFE